MGRIEERLFVNRLMSTPEEAKAFDVAVQEVVGVEGLDLRALLRVFDDKCAHHEVMWGLIHLVEHFPIEAYVAAILDQAEHLAAVAPEWLDTMLARLLNDSASAAVLADKFRSARAETRLLLRPTLVAISKSKAPGAFRGTALLDLR